MKNKEYIVVIELADSYNNKGITERLKERMFDSGFHNTNYPNTMYCIISDMDYSEIQEIAINACEDLGSYKICVIEKTGMYFTYGA